MNTKLLVLIALFYSLNAQSFSNFLENPYTPYPAGCVTLPKLQSLIYGDTAFKVYDEEISLPSANNPQNGLAVRLAVYRVTCAEPNRSVIWLEFSIPESLDPANTFYRVLGIYAGKPGGTVYSMRLAEEPGQWGGTEHHGNGQIFGGNSPGTVDGHDRKWLFILENAAPQSVTMGDEEGDYVPGLTDFMTAEEYNDAFQLEILLNVLDGWVVEIPSTASLPNSTPGFPISGRLSGNWVIDGASDQGIALAISELPGSFFPYYLYLEDSLLSIFLTWNTYDLTGNLLWLTGSVNFNMGQSQVFIPIELVYQGQFLGSKAAARQRVGSVTIKANSCNDLTFHYDLDDIFMGTGTRHLHRLFSMETAGYTCRDRAARIEAR